MNQKKMLCSFLTIFGILLNSSFSFAQPFTPTIGSDSYGISQGIGNNPLIPTPNDSGDGTPQIYDAVNLLLGTSYSTNSQLDFLRYTGPDKVWMDLSTANNKGTFVAIGLTAENTNTFGVYPLPLEVHMPVLGPYSGFNFLGGGTSSNPFPAALSPLTPGTNFGWYLDTVNGPLTRTWDSDPGKNENGLDHMLTYHLPNLTGTSIYFERYTCNNQGSQCKVIEKYTFNDPYLLAWEDLPLRENGLLGDEDYNDFLVLVDRVRPVPEPLSFIFLGSGFLGLVGIRKKRVDTNPTYQALTSQ